MGWTVWTPKEGNFDIDSFEGKIKVKPLIDNKYIVKFLKDVPVQQENSNPIFNCWAAQYQLKERTISVSDTYWSSKEGTIRDVKSDFDKNFDRCETSGSSKSTMQFIWDDYQLIKDKQVKIRAIGVYSCHYIQGIKLKYETIDNKVFTTFHRFPTYNPINDPKMKFKEMELDDFEFIEHIYWVKSMQTNFIRNITFITNLNRNLCVEGEVEIFDILQSQNSCKGMLDKDQAKDIRNELIYNLAAEEETGANNIFKNESINIGTGGKSIILEGEDDEFSIRKPSINGEFIK